MTFGRSANIRRKCAPVAAEPVNSNPSMSAPASAAPVSFPPWTTVNTPAGRPAARQASAIASPTAGVSSDGLNTTRIPRQQRRDDMAIGQVAGEIVRPQHGHRPVGMVAQHRFAKGHGGVRLSRPLGLRGDRQIDLAHHRADFGAALPKRLARLAGDQPRERFGAGFQHGLVDAGQGDALRQRCRGPGRNGLPGDRDRAQHAVRECGFAFPDDVPRSPDRTIAACRSSCSRPFCPCHGEYTRRVAAVEAQVDLARGRIAVARDEFIEGTRHFAHYGLAASATEAALDFVREQCRLVDPPAGGMLDRRLQRIAALPQAGGERVDIGHAVSGVVEGVALGGDPRGLCRMFEQDLVVGKRGCRVVAGKSAGDGGQPPPRQGRAGSDPRDARASSSVRPAAPSGSRDAPEHPVRSGSRVFRQVRDVQFADEKTAARLQAGRHG